MCIHRSRHCVGIARAHSIDDRLVLASGSLTLTRQVHDRLARLLEPVVEIREETGDEAAAACCGYGSMKSNVEVRDLLGVGVAMDRVEKCLVRAHDSCDSGRVLEANGSLRRECRQRTSHLEHVDQLFEMAAQPPGKRLAIALGDVLRDEVSTAVSSFYEPHPDEALDSLAHAQPTDAEQFNKFALGRQALARFVCARCDSGFQLLTNSICPRTAWWSGGLTAER